MAGRDQNGRIFRRRADERELVGSGGAKNGPHANRGKLAEVWHVLEGALQHPRENGFVHSRIFRTVLARRTDQYLACFSRLYVEGHGISGERMRAFQVAQLDDLMMEKIRIAIGDYQVAFAGFDIYTA